MSSKKSKKRIGSTRRHHQGLKTEEKEGNAELQESSSAEHLQPSEMSTCQLDSVPENIEGDQHDASQTCPEKLDTGARAEICEAETRAFGKKRRMGSTRRAKQEAEERKEEEERLESMQIIQEEFNITVPEDQYLKDHSNTPEGVSDEAQTQLMEVGESKVKEQAEMTEDEFPNEQHRLLSGLDLKTETDACSAESPSPAVNLIVSVTGIHPNEEEASNKQDQQSCVRMFEAKEISNFTPLQDVNQGLDQQTDESADVSKREEQWGAKDINLESNVDMESITVGDNKPDVFLREKSQEIMQIEKVNDGSVRETEIESAVVQDFDMTQKKALPSTESLPLVKEDKQVFHPTDANADGIAMEGYSKSGNPNLLETEQTSSINILQEEEKNSEYDHVQKPKKRMGSIRRPLKGIKIIKEDIGNSQGRTQEIRENTFQDPKLAEDDTQFRELTGFTDKLEMAFAISIKGEDLERTDDVIEEPENKHKDLIAEENTGQDTEACPSTESLTDDSRTSTKNSHLVMEGLDHHRNKIDRGEGTSINQERSSMVEMFNPGLLEEHISVHLSSHALEEEMQVVDQMELTESAHFIPELTPQDVNLLQEHDKDYKEQGPESPGDQEGQSCSNMEVLEQAEVENKLSPLGNPCPDSVDTTKQDAERMDSFSHQIGFGTLSSFEQVHLSSSPKSQDIVVAPRHAHAESSSLKMYHHDMKHGKETELGTQAYILSYTMESEAPASTSSIDVLDLTQSLHVESVGTSETSTLPDHSESSFELQHHEEEEIAKQDALRQKRRMGSTRRAKREHKMEETCEAVITEGDNTTEDMNTNADVTAEAGGDILEVEIIGTSRETEFVTNQINVETPSIALTLFEQDEDVDKSTTAKIVLSSFPQCNVQEDGQKQENQHEYHNIATEQLDDNDLKDNNEISILGKETAAVATNLTDIEMIRSDVQQCEEEEKGAQSQILSYTLEVSNICTVVPDFSHSVQLECTDTSKISTFPDHSESSLELQRHEEEGSVKHVASRQKRRIGSTRRTNREQKMEETCGVMSTEGYDANGNMDVKTDADLRAKAEGDIIGASLETEFVTSQTEVECLSATLTSVEQDQYVDSSTPAEMMSSSIPKCSQEDEQTQESQHQHFEATAEQPEDDYLKDCNKIFGKETMEDRTTVETVLFNEASISDIGDQLQGHENDKLENSLESLGPQNLEDIDMIETKLSPPTEDASPDSASTTVEDIETTEKTESFSCQIGIENVTCLGSLTSADDSNLEDIEDINMMVSEQAVEKMLSSSGEDLSPDCSATIVENMDVSAKTGVFSCQISVETLTCLGSFNSLDPFPETAVAQQNVSLEVNTPDVQHSQEAEQGTQVHILSSTMESETPGISRDISDPSYSLDVESTVRSETGTVSEHSESSLKLQHHKEEEVVKQGASRQKKRMGSTRRAKREQKMEETCEVLKETIPEQAEVDSKLSHTEDPSPDSVATTVKDIHTTETTELFSCQIGIENISCLGSLASSSPDHIPEIAITTQQTIPADNYNLETYSPDLKHSEEKEQRTQVAILSSTVVSEAPITADVSDCSHLVDHDEDGSVKQGASRQKRRMGSTRRTKREHKMEETCGVMSAEGDDATEDMDIDADLRAETGGDVLKVDIILASKETELVSNQTNVETVGMASSLNEQDQYADSSISSEMVSSFLQYNPQDDELKQEKQNQRPYINTEQLDQFKKYEDENLEKSLEPLGHLNIEDINMKVSEQAVEKMLSSSGEALSPDCSATVVENMDVSAETESFSCQISVETLTCLGSANSLDPFPETTVAQQNVSLEVNTPDAQHSQEAEQGTQVHILSSTMESEAPGISRDISDSSYSLDVESTVRSETDTVSEYSESSLKLQHHEEEEGGKHGASRQKKRMGSTRRAKREQKMEETCEVLKETIPEHAEVDSKLSHTEDPSPDSVATTVKDIHTTETTELFSCQIGIENISCLGSLASSSPDHTPEIAITTQQTIPADNYNLETYSPDLKHSEEKEQRTQVPILSSTVVSEEPITADVSDCSHLVDHDEDGSVKQGASRQKRRMGSTRRTKREHKMEETCGVMSAEGDDATEDMDIDADLRAETGGDVLKVDIILASKETELVSNQTNVETVGMASSLNEQDQYADSSISSEMVSSFLQYNPQDDELKQENQNQRPYINAEQLDQFQKYEDENLEKSLEPLGHLNIEDINMKVSEQAVEKMLSSSGEALSPDCSATVVENMDVSAETESFSCQISVETLTCLGSANSLDPFPETTVAQQNVSLEVNTPDAQHSQEAEQGTQVHILSSTMESEAPGISRDISDSSYSLDVESTVRSETDTVSEYSESSLKLQHHEEEEGGKHGASRQKKRMGSTRRAKRGQKMEETCELLKETIPELAEVENNLSPKEDPSPDSVSTTVEDMDTTEKTESFSCQTDIKTLTWLGSPPSHTPDHVPEIAVTQQNVHVESSDQDESSFKLHEKEKTAEVVTSQTGIKINSPDVQWCEEEEQLAQSHILSSTSEVSKICTLVPDFSHSINVKSTDTPETSTFPDHSESFFEHQHHEEEEGVKQGASRQKRRMGSTRRTNRKHKMEETCEVVITEGEDATEDMNVKTETDVRAEAEGTQTDVETLTIASTSTEQDQGLNSSTSTEMVPCFPHCSLQEDKIRRENQHQHPNVIPQQLDDLRRNTELSTVEKETSVVTLTVGAEVFSEASVDDNGDQLKMQEEQKSEKILEPLDDQKNGHITSTELSEQAEVENKVSSTTESPILDTTVEQLETSESPSESHIFNIEECSSASEPEHLKRDLKATPRKKIGSTRRVNRKQEDRKNKSKDEEKEEMQIISKDDNKVENILFAQDVEVVEAQREEGTSETQRVGLNDTAEEQEMIKGQIQNTVPEMSVTVSQYQDTEGSPGLARRRKLGSTRRSRKEQTERKYVVMDGMLMYTDTETNSTHDSKSVDGEMKEKEEKGIHGSEENTEVVPCNTVVSLPESLETIQETSNHSKDELSEKEQCILSGSITAAELPRLVDMAGNDNGDTLAVNSGTTPTNPTLSENTLRLTHLETSDSSEESKPRKKRMGSSRKKSQHQNKDKTESHDEADVRNEDIDSLTNADKPPVEQDTDGTGAAYKAVLEGLLNDKLTDIHESECSEPASGLHSHPEGPSVSEFYDQSHLGLTEISVSSGNSAAETSIDINLCADDSPKEHRSVLHKRKMGSSRRGQGLGNRMKGAATVEEHVDDINTLRQATRDDTALQSKEDLSVEDKQLPLESQSSKGDEQPLTQGETPDEVIDERAFPESAQCRTSVLSASSSASSEPQEDNPSIDPQSNVKKRKMGSTRKNMRRHGEDTNSALMREQAQGTERCSDDTATGDMEVLPVPAETVMTQKMSEVVQPEDIVTQAESTGHGSPGHKQDSDSTRRKMGSRRGGQGYRGIEAIGSPEDQPVSQGQDNDSSLLQGTQGHVYSEGVTDQGPSKQGSQSERGIQKLEQPPSGARGKSDLERDTLISLGEAVMFNIVMVGESSVGKTSFIQRLEKGQFYPDPSATLGVDTSILTLVVDDKPVKLQIWDTAGQERFHSITRNVLHKAQGLILMYDISSCQSFSAVRKWIACIEEGAPSEVIIMLLGNKNDSEDRQVLHPEGKRLAEEYNIHFMECSAVTGYNVSQAMETLARLLKQTVKETDRKYVSLDKKPKQKKSGCC